MGRVGDFRLFVADQYIKQSAGLFELEKALVFADDLWDRAAKGDRKARLQLGKLVKMYQNKSLSSVSR